MNIPWHELLKGTGIIKKIQKHPTPPGTLSLDGGKISFNKSVDVTVNNKKTVVIADELFSLLNQYVYEDNEVELLQTLKELTLNLLEAGVETYIYSQYTPIRLEVSLIKHTTLLEDVLQDCNSNFIKSEFYSAFAKINIPADMLYIINVPKFFQIICDLPNPSVTDKFLALFNKHYNNKLETMYEHQVSITSVSIPHKTNKTDTSSSFVHEYFINELKSLLDSNSLNDVEFLTIKNYSNIDSQGSEISKDSEIEKHNEIISPIFNLPKLIYLEIIDGNIDWEMIKYSKPNKSLKYINFNGCEVNNFSSYESPRYLTNLLCCNNNDVIILPNEPYRGFIQPIALDVDEVIEANETKEYAAVVRIIEQDDKCSIVNFNEICKLLDILVNTEVIYCSLSCFSPLAIERENQIASLAKLGVRCIISKKHDKYQLSKVEQPAASQDMLPRFTFNNSEEVPTYNVKKIFFAKTNDKDPPPECIRKEVYEKYSKNVDAFFLSDSIEISLKAIKPNIKQINEIPPDCEADIHITFRDKLNADEFLGTFFVQLTEQWTPLPSLSTNDALLKISVMDKNNQHQKIELGFCNDTGLYFIRLPQGLASIEARINIIIKKDRNFDKAKIFFEKNKNIYFKICELIKYYKSFNVDDMPKISAPNSLQDLVSDLSFLENSREVYVPPEVIKYPLESYLDLLEQRRAGACQERAILFSRKLQTLPITVPYDVRIISNDVHMFCEIKFNDIWLKVDLGGAPALVNVENAEQFIPPKPKHFDSNDLSKAKTLLHLNHIEIESYGLGLFKKFHEEGLLVFYANNYNDLKIDDEYNEFNRFIQLASKSESYSVLIINWYNFSASEKVRVNFILDTPNKYIPTTLRIIGMEDPYIEQYSSDAAFLSRFDAILLKDNSIQPYVVDSTIQANTSVMNGAISIECYESPNWKDIIFGEYCIDNARAFLKENELLQRLEVKNDEINSKRKKRATVDIIFNNPPLEEDDFRLFCAKASITGKFYLGMTQKEYFGFKKIYYTRKYDWSLSHIFLFWHNIPEPQQEIFILNQTLLGFFLNDYYFTKDKGLGVNPGIIERNKNKFINVILTHNLNHLQWLRLLNECQKWSVKMHIIPCIDLELPDGFNKPNFNAISPFKEHNCYLSNNPEHDASILLKNTREGYAFDISEVETGELISNVSISEQDGKYYYDHIESDIISALRNGKNIILYGKITQDFAERFASVFTPIPFLWVNGEKVVFTGKLTCIIDENSAIFFKFLPRVNRFDFSYGANIKLNNNSVIGNDDESRTKLVLGKLSQSPMAYISGQTGIGKTTFMLEHMRDRLNYQVFNGLELIHNWSQCKVSDKYIILFVDEANMQGSDFTIFSSMFFNNSIFYKGKVLQLTDKHKVVCAGNPSSYGGDRKIPELLLSHPDIEVIFGPLSEKIIESICIPHRSLFFSANKLEQRNQDNKLLLEVYNKFANIDDNNVYLTLRELKLALTLSRLNYSLNVMLYLICKDILPEEQLPNLEDLLLTKCKNYQEIEQQILIKKIIANSDNYLVTASRYPTLLMMHALLEAREKIVLQDQSNLDIAGIVIEGPAGTGKSELVRFILGSKNFIEVKADSAIIAAIPNGESRFCIIRASLGYDSVRKILIAAYKKGLVVIIDEINTCLRGLETILNQMLMHKYEENGIKVENKGFLLFGTQNPIATFGRDCTSNALQRRLLHTSVSDYTIDEMTDILSHKYRTVSKEQILELIEEFMDNRYTFLDSGVKNPEPRSFRELDTKVAEIALVQNGKAKKARLI